MGNKKPTNNQLTKVILSFLDEFHQRYLVLEDLDIYLGNDLPSSGFNNSNDQNSILFKIEGNLPFKKSLETEIKTFVDLNEFNYSDPDDRTLFKVMMTYMDHFINGHSVIENIRIRDQNSLHINGYRYNNERVRSDLSYSISGIQPSREEIERQVMAFIQLKHLQGGL